MAAVKALQQWCRVQCEGYRDVSITNMTTSFRDGLAFCALIHKHRPDLINFDSLKKENVYDNNKLAFKVAEQELGIPALLDAEDMVALKVPDRLSILTYVSQYYNYFHGRSPIGGMGGIKRPADGPTDEPSGKKNQPVTSKVFPSSKPARENSPPPKPARNSTQDVLVERSHQTGTLSNKCVSCNKHVHLVQRHLVDGKLYHRNCAKSLSPISTIAPFRDLPTNTHISKFTPLQDSSKTNTATSTNTPSRLGPAWVTEKPTSPPRITSTPPKVTNSTPTVTSIHPTVTSSSPKVTRVLPTVTSSSPKVTRVLPTVTTTSPKVTSVLPTVTSTPPRVTSVLPTVTSTPPRVTSVLPTVTSTPPRVTSVLPTVTSTPPRVTSVLPTVTSTPPRVTSTFSASSPSWSPSGLSSTAKESTTVSKPAPSRDTTATATTSVTTRPTAAPRTSATAAKTLQSKLKFFQSDNTASSEEKKTSSVNIDINKGQNVSSKAQEATAGQAVTVVVNISRAGQKDPNESLSKAGNKAKVTGTGVKVSLKPKEEEDKKTKAEAAAFISKKLAEENNNNNSKPSWMNVALKKTDKPQSLVETPKKATEGVRGRVKLRADPSLLADLHPPDSPKRARSPAGKSSLTAGTPDKGGSKLRSASPNTSAASENESPADWRSMLKPVSNETKPAGPPQSSPKPWRNGAAKTSEVSAGPSSSSSHLPSLSISVTPPSKGFQNGQREQTANGTKPDSKTSKTKPDYIPKEDIMKELQEIEDNLNELEKRGVELEMKLRSSEEEGVDDSVMDELMVEWFNLIRNKQVAMRRESELVYIGRTQDLEEQQPSVEQELRRLMEKPERLKTAWDRKREEQLMAKLMEIVNDRNAIVEGLDEDRLREEEEDEQLNKMMMNFNFKKDKQKKKSPMSKLFGWGNKKEG